MVQASQESGIWRKNEHGHMVKVYTQRSALEELKRPPFILTAPLTKKEWSPEEIEKFYQSNPVF